MLDKKEESLDKEFTAYIIRGNRQVIEREVKASRKFKIGDETYIIKSDCIFLKKVNGKLKSISVYREGNPNPYNFDIAPENLYIKKYRTVKDKKTGIEKKEQNGKTLYVNKGELIPNSGLSTDELCDIYGGDMFNILIHGQQEDKMSYSLLLIIANLILCVASFIVITFGSIVLGG